MQWYCQPSRLFAAVIVLALLGAQSPPVSAQLPAGSTNAVLSFIDAAGAHVSVVRHWTGAGTGQDTQVFPFTPYFWDGCLPFQNGALMFLVTSPVGFPAPGLTSAETYTTQYLTRLGQTLSSNVMAGAAQMGQQQAAQQNLQQIALGLTTPGDPAYESMKAALGQVNSLNAYEDYGYAVFMFIRWKWVPVLGVPVPTPCAEVDFRTIPEGYAIPFVARTPGGDEPAVLARRR